MSKLIKKNKIVSLIRYAFVGVNGTIVDVGSLAIFIEFFHLRLGLATSISFTLAVVHNFIFNKWWTFKDNSPYVFHQYIKFFSVSIIGFLLTLSSMYLLTIYFGLWYILSKIFTSALVWTWNFLANYHWTFKENIVTPHNKEYLYEYSVVIPAYNESKRIVETINSVSNYFFEKKIPFEIIVVDDGSKDATYKTALNLFEKKFLESHKGVFNYLCLKLDRNYGKGRAVRTGVLSSRGKYILYMDADGATPIKEVEKLAKYIEDYEIVIGSRMDTEIIQKHQPLHRKFMGKLRKISTFFILRGIQDTQCGFKLMKADVAYYLFNRITIDRFGFDIELLVLAKIKKFKIIEIPVVWSHIGESNVRPVADTLLSLKDVIFIYFNSFTGRYR